MKYNLSWFKFGIGFWTGALVYSIINILISMRNSNYFVEYNLMISLVALAGIILNIIMYRLKGDKKI